MSEIIYSKRGTAAKNYFFEGYNCTQSVVLAFSDIIDINRKLLLNLASPFGGGMGRMREVCGAVSGMYIVLGYVCGYNLPEDKQGKIDLYAKVRELADKVRESRGSIVCRELLATVQHTECGIPEERTAEYYKKRPCGDIIAQTAQILEEYLLELGIELN